jgi:tetratricopeptide (TPR) repeat protein
MKSTMKGDIESAIESEQWQKAEKLLRAAVHIEPDSHWLHTRLATSLYEQERYADALEANERAYVLKPTCPLVLWDRACIFDMIDHTDEAISVWRRLLKKGPKAVAENECGEGMKWAQSLLNDCRYRLAFAYADKKQSKEARSYLRRYLSHCESGISTIFDLKEADYKLEQQLT